MYVKLQPRDLIQVFLTLVCGLIFVGTIFAGNGQDGLSRSRDVQHKKDGEDLIPRYAMKTVSAPKYAGLVFCNDTRLMPLDTFPPIALASFPGSGNTWVRHLIEAATGYATGSVYNSHILIKQGFIGEKERAMSGRALTIKTHTFTDKIVGAILLVRNPYRAMFAEYNRRKAGKTGHAPEENFKTPGWSKFVKKMASSWIKLYQDYITHCHHPGNTCKSMLIVYYEQLKEQPANELRRILEYLSVDVDEERLACVLTNSEGLFHRPKRNRTFDPYLQKDRSLVDSSMNTYCDLIEQEGLENPPLSFTSYPSDF